MNPAKSANSRRLVVVALFIMLTLSSVFAVPAVSQAEFAVVVEEQTLSVDNATTIEVTSAEAEHLRVVGDTEGWTVKSMSPTASLLGNPSRNDSFPYETGNESWFFAETTHDTLVIDLQATVPAGEYQFTAQELNTTDSVVAEEEFTITVEETDTTPPTVAVVPVTFDAVQVGESATRTITVTNTGERPVDIAEITTDNDAFEIAWERTRLEPSASAEGSVTFSPAEPGEFTTALTVVTSEGSLAQEVTLQGEGIPVTDDDSPSQVDDIEPADSESSDESAPAEEDSSQTDESAPVEEDSPQTDDSAPADDESTDPAEEFSDEFGPGFGVVPALLGVLVAVLVARRQPR